LTSRTSSNTFGPGSVVSIATGYGLDGPAIESRWEARFSAPVQTWPWGPPRLLYNEYRIFPGGKERPGRDADPSLPSSAVGHERLELYLCSPYGPYGLYRASVHVQVLNLKVDRQLSREYFTSDAIYNGAAGMALYYYMCRSWQDCCRRGENRSWPSVPVESVDSECWCLNNAIFYFFIMRLTVEERVFILESYLKTVPYAHCRQSFFEKFRRKAPVICAIAKMIKK